MSARPAGSASALSVLLMLDLGTRLGDWLRTGTLDRELAVYRRLLSSGVPVTVLSWARGEDSELAEQVRPIELLQNLGRRRNRVWMLRTLWSQLGRDGGPRVLLTNQIAGAELALAVCLLRRRPLVVRCGYLRSENVALASGPWSPAALLERLREVVVALGCSRFVVSAERMRALLTRRYPWLRRRIEVLPNYVDLQAFRPLPRDRDRDELRLVYTGRLSAEKNLDALVRAVAASRGVRLTVIGSGPEQPALARLVESLDAPVEFAGQLRNEDLPERYSDADVFVLVSRYEGNPKALLEAMACGLCVLGSRAEGIAAVVADGATGLLVEPEPAALVAAIDRLRDKGLRARLGSAACRAVVASNGLDGYAERLLRILREAAAESRTIRVEGT